MSLYNENNKVHLITVVLEMADIFEDVGLLWAARNFYYFDFCLCMNQYMKFGEVLPALFISANALKYIELRLGHILYATCFDELADISMHLYPQNIELEDKESNNFDYILAIQILRTSYEVEKSLGQLPDYLESRGLIFSSVAMKYELGYYDESMLEALNNSKEAFDDLIEKWRLQPALEKLNYLPWYGIEHSCQMQTNILGCSIGLRALGPYEHGEIEIGATILATLESFFGTGVSNELISFTGKIQIELYYDSSCCTLIEGRIHDDKPNIIKVIFKDYDSQDIVAAQGMFSNFMTNLISMVTAIMFPYNTELYKIENMIKNDAAFDRSQTFSNSVFYGMETLGKTTFSFSSVIDDYKDMQMKRAYKSISTDIKGTEEDEKTIIPETIHYSKPPEECGFKNVSNANIITSSIINVPLWNVCDWRGVMFMADPLHRFPPILSLVFAKTGGKNIFDAWIKDVGYSDNKNEIGIRIIKGIDKKHPYWYRVIIGQLGFPNKNVKNPQIIAMPARCHTMQPSNDVNLKMFEKELKFAKTFSLCPSYMSNSTEQPQVYDELMIKKKLESILICNAFDLKKDDWLSFCGILPTDDPIIPVGKENAPILEMIERKNSFIK